MYSINWQKLTQGLLPSFIGDKLLAYASAKHKPLEQLHALWLKIRDALIAETNQTGQVIALEYLLNRKFGGITDKILAYKPATYFHETGPAQVLPIYIEQTDPLIKPYLYNKAEQKPLFVGNNNEAFEIFLININDNSFSDFIVHYHVSIQLDVTHFKALINKYKLAGFTYKLQPYE
ncbi:MAG: hypothetical protein PHG67_06225 [Bacteroidales bacterium]|jgi:hypothetical protein|nr:hypothetical protein [Bacteroidales bacterium]